MNTLQAKHSYTIKNRQGKWEINISPDTAYGYFEHDVHGDGGGLWFDREKNLDDFDGRTFLPLAVADAIIAAGYKVEKALFCNMPRKHKVDSVANTIETETGVFFIDVYDAENGTITYYENGIEKTASADQYVMDGKI